MEKDLGEYKDARLIFERALKQFSSGSDEKQSLWRAYELMESETGNLQAAQNVYQRAIRDALVTDNLNEKADYIMTSETGAIVSDEESLKNSNEVEVVRWKTKKYNGFGENSVWLNDGLIEGKVPKSIMKKKNK
jgi:tetratricopeptide (TPR) repeat protein